MGRVWLEAATLAHTERAVPLSKTHSLLEKKQPLASCVYWSNLRAGSVGRSRLPDWDMGPEG